MDEVDTQLSLTVCKAVKFMEEKFPEASKKYCPSRTEGMCARTGKKCEFWSCPKIREEVKARIE